MQRRSRFAGARIRISDLNEPDSAAFFWPTPEDIVETPPAWPMSRQGRTSPRRWSVTSTTFFRLQTSTSEDAEPADESEPLPESVDAALIVELDVPCVLDLAALDVAYHPVTRSFYSGDGKMIDKQILRFPGELSVSREVLVRMPSNTIIKSARLETVESFPTDRPLVSGNDSPNALLTQDKERPPERRAMGGTMACAAAGDTVSGVAIALLGDGARHARAGRATGRLGRSALREKAGGGLTHARPGRPAQLGHALVPRDRYPFLGAVLDPAGNRRRAGDLVGGYRRRELEGPRQNRRWAVGVKGPRWIGVDAGVARARRTDAAATAGFTRYWRKHRGWNRRTK